MGKGCLIQPLKIKDYRLELLPTAVVLPTTYSLRDKVGKIKSQNGSGSCSSQATSYYAEVLNNIETGEKVQLSPRFLYPFVYIEWGSYIKDNFARVCNEGIALEADVPSYENGNAPSEKWMTQKPTITPEIADRAKTYIAKKYLTWDNKNLDSYKKAIYQGNGCVVASQGNNYCWGLGLDNGMVQLPAYSSQLNWYHAIYLCGWDDNKKAFEFVNSWSENWGNGWRMFI